MMTPQERFRRTMKFQEVDRRPMIEWAAWWGLTTDRWQREGLVLPKPMKYINEAQLLERELGLDINLQAWWTFKTEKTPDTSAYGRPAVESMADYERILPTLYPENPINEDSLKAIRDYRETEGAIVWYTFEGAFWGPRSLLGIEPHLYAFYDQPELLHRICDDLFAYNERVFRRAIEIAKPEFVTLAEDMSYNNGPMISEAQFKEFMAPYYKRFTALLHEYDVPLIVDSDGDITMAFRWFHEAGADGILPLERQAGTDINRLRELYPDGLFVGHYDKMVMPLGEEAMRAEFERLLPQMRRGGFVASVDHQTPPSVSFENYKIYLRLLKEYSEKAAR